MENFDALTNETQDYADHLKYLKSKKYVTIEDFISHFGLTKAVGLKILDRLQTADKIASFEGKNGTYYISKKGISFGDLENLGAILDKNNILSEEYVENATEKIEDIRGELKKIYVNLITLMSIFIAVFSLVIVNSNIIFKITEKNINKFIFQIICVNLSVCLSMIIFILLIRLIVINPLIRNKKK